ncbi:MAG: Holliday junction branch migration DNA helicase RuvB, partial [Flavobacteriales bacterium]
MEDFDLRGAAEGTSEGEVERVLRPSGFHEFAGQREALENLEV